jgi:hypothetical protein
MACRVGERRQRRVPEADEGELHQREVADDSFEVEHEALETGVARGAVRESGAAAVEADELVAGGERVEERAVLGDGEFFAQV